MAIQTQDQLIAQALGQLAQGGGGMAPGFPQPTGLPGAPALDPQMMAQALSAPPTGMNPQMVAGNPAAAIPDPGSFGNFLQRMRAYQTCVMSGRDDCGPQPQQSDVPQPAPAAGPYGV